MAFFLCKPDCENECAQNTCGGLGYGSVLASICPSHSSFCELSDPCNAHCKRCCYSHRTVMTTNHVSEPHAVLRINLRRAQSPKSAPFSPRLHVRTSIHSIVSSSIGRVQTHCKWIVIRATCHGLLVAVYGHLEKFQNLEWCEFASANSFVQDVKLCNAQSGSFEFCHDYGLLGNIRGRNPQSTGGL